MSKAAETEQPSEPLLKAWMRENGHATDYEWLAGKLASKPTAESIRQVANGYRIAGWDLAFELEALTGISAHDLRNGKVAA